MSPASGVLELLADWATVEMSRAEVFRAHAEWRARFVRGSPRQLANYDWHLFTFDHHPSFTGESARRRYRAVQREGQLSVVSAWNRKPFGLFVGGGGLPDLECKIDLLIFDESLSWTMALTHSGHGPFFAVAREPDLVE